MSVQKSLPACLFVLLAFCITAVAQTPPQQGDVASKSYTRANQPESDSDPTSNVLGLVEAAVKRLDDLRSAENRRMDDLRSLDSDRTAQLRAAESRRVDEQAKMRAEFEDTIKMSESKRIDAIRAVDVGAVAVASERATQQATVLANQVAASAESLRTLVATTAAAMAVQSQNLSTQFTDRLALLEKSQYENKGRSNVTDPQIADLVSEMRAFSRSSATNAGKTEGISTSWAMLLGVIAAGGVLYGAMGKRQAANGRPSPQVIYTTASPPA